MKPNISFKPQRSLKPLFLILPILIFLLLLGAILYVGKTDLKTYDSVIRNSEEFCFEGNFLFPSLYKLDSPIPSSVDFKNEIKIFNRFPIYTNQICFKSKEYLPEKNEYTFRLNFLGQTGIDFFEKEIPLVTDELANVQVVNLNEKVNTTDNISYELEYTDEYLDYFVTYDGSDLKIPCQTDRTNLECNLTELNLKYDTKYKISVLAMNEDEIVKEFEAVDVQTLTSVQVIGSSIQNGSVISSPTLTSINLELNKEVESTCTLSLNDSSGNSIHSSCTVNGKSISISISESLKQSTQYTLKLTNLIGLDKSKMSNDYILQFSVSDGPRIVGTNISSTNFPVSSNLTLTFDQDINTKQDIKSLIKFNSTTQYSYTISGKKITINPDINLSGCTQYTLSLSKGLKSTSGLISTKTYNYTLKTTCGRVIYIGKSVQGRGIYATYFGSGSKKILFYGAIHGSESNTASTMRKWAKELELNYYKIPSDKTVIVISTLNPDAVANKSRFNANGVDVNRNFDTADWSSGTYFKSTYYPTGGGPYPFSEPESVAIRNLINREGPYLTLAYHSAAGYVIPSALSKSREYGGIYSQMTRYRYIEPGSQGSFSYDITGSFDDWGEQSGHTTLTIELSSAYSDEFDRNLAAMWKMVSL